MKPRQGALILAIVSIFAITNAGADHNLTVYTDRAAWEAAVGGSFTEEDFEAFNGVSYEFSPVDVGDFDVSVSGTTFGFIWHNIGPVSNSNDVNGTSQINGATGDVGGTSLTFDTPINAFGGNWQGISDNRVTTLNIDGTLLEIPNLNGGFYGVVSDQPFTDSLLFLSSGEADGFGIDNAVYANALPPPPDDTTFSIVIIPDTQMYVESHPEIVEAQMEWIVANQAVEDIIYVGHLGDLKDDLKCNNKLVGQGSGNNRTEWQIIDDAFKILEAANIPYGVVPGNHDFDQVGVGAAAQCPFAECTVNGAGVLSCAGRPLGTDDMSDPPASFNSVMGPSRFDGTIAATEQSTYGDSVGLGITSTIRTGNRAASNNEDNFSLVEFGDVKFVIINLGYRKGHNGVIAGETSVCDSIGNPELSWADDLLKEYPDRLGIVTSHGFLLENQNDPGRNRFDDYGSAVHTCLADNRNFLFMTSAHRWGESWGRNARDAQGWPPVHALLSDYQRVNYLLANGTVPSTSDDFENLSADNAFGDGGYMRILRFDTATGLVNVGTFAPPVKFADDSDVPYSYPPDPDNANLHDDHWHEGLGAADSRERPGLTSIFTPTYTLNSAGRIIFDTDNGMHQDTASNFCFTFWGYRGIAGEVPSVCP